MDGVYCPVLVRSCMDFGVYFVLLYTYRIRNIVFCERYVRFVVALRYTAYACCVWMSVVIYGESVAWLGSGNIHYTIWSLCCREMGILNTVLFGRVYGTLWNITAISK